MDLRRQTNSIQIIVDIEMDVTRHRNVMRKVDHSEVRLRWREMKEGRKDCNVISKSQLPLDSQYCLLGHRQGTQR